MSSWEGKEPAQGYDAELAAEKWGCARSQEKALNWGSFTRAFLEEKCAWGLGALQTLHSVAATSA